ncbi:hypothetical protein ACJX0J_035133, partial [Zea mays]
MGINFVLFIPFFVDLCCDEVDRYNTFYTFATLYVRLAVLMYISVLEIITFLYNTYMIIFFSIDFCASPLFFELIMEITKFALAGRDKPTFAHFFLSEQG